MALSAAEMAREIDRDKARRRSLGSVSKPKPAYKPWTGGGDASFVTPPGATPFVEYGPNRSGDRRGGNLPTSGTTQTQPNIPAPAPAAPAAPRPLNWRDAAYNAQIAAVERALRDFETGATRRGERYGEDYLTSVRRLGYRPGEGFQAMPNLVEATQAAAATRAAEDAAEPLVTPVSGAFDIEGQYDPYSTAAQGTRSMRDVFAGRGTLRSSDFAKSFGEFQNRLNRQLEAMETSRGRFAEDLAQEIAAQRTGAQERREAAQREAMMRAAMAAAGGAGF